MLMTREGFSHSGRLGTWVDWDWREVNLLHPPLLPCVCTLGTGYDENAHVDHVGSLPRVLSSTDLFGGLFLVIELPRFHLPHLDKEVLWIRFGGISTFPSSCASQLTLIIVSFILLCPNRDCFLGD